MAPRIFIFSIVLGDEYLSYVKSIATNAPTFFGYIISVLASVKAIPDEWKAKSDIQRHSDRHIPQTSNFGLDQRVHFI